MSIYYCALIGLVLTVVIVIITEFYTGIYSPVKSIAEASTTGHGTNIIAGLAVSMQATAAPVLAICVSYSPGLSTLPASTASPWPPCPCFP